MANNQNFIIRQGLTVGNTAVVDSVGNWIGPDTPYANASFAVANVKARTYTQDTPPSTANVGDFWIDSSNGIEYLYTTSNSANIWIEYGPIGSLTGNITFSDQTITGSVSNRDLVIVQQGTGNITLQSANTKVTGVITLINSSFSQNTPALSIIGSSTGGYQYPSNPGYMIHATGQANTPSRIVNDSFGTGAYGVFVHRTARGSAESPSASLNGDVVGRWAASAYDGTSFARLGVARIDIVTTENQTVSNKGSEIQFWTTQQGGNTLSKVASFNGNTVTITGSFNPAGGFIYTPLVYETPNTTFHINFSTQSAIRAKMNADTTITFNNFVAGKIIDFFIQNIDNNAHQLKHGCLANNSTKGTTSTQIAAGGTAYLRYISYDGDVANTFVAITYL